MAVSCSVIFDLAAMLDVEPALGGYVLVVASTACGCEMVSRCDWCVRRNKWRVARAAREQHTQAVLSCAAASAGVTLRRWHLLATDVLTDRADASVAARAALRARVRRHVEFA